MEVIENTYKGTHGLEHIMSESISSQETIVDIVISSAMFHSKKDEAKRFLTFIDSVIEYYLQRENEGDKICFPIIYIPNSPEWARDICAKYLILRLSLFYNEDKRIAFSNWLKAIPYHRTDEEAKLFKKYTDPCRKYLRAILKVIPETYLGKSGHKNLIFCGEEDIMVSRSDKHPYIKEFYNVDDVCSSDNLTICHNITAKDIRKALQKQKEAQPQIDNVFILYTNNEECNSLNDTALKRWNCGLKNCFVFNFSDKPQRLYHTLNKKKILVRKFPYLADKDALLYEHFITLSENESNYLFGLPKKQEHIYIDDDQLFFDECIEYLINDAERPILARNHFALCLDAYRAKQYATEMQKTYPSYPYETYNLSIEYQLENAQKVIIPRIEKFINNEPRVAIILPYDHKELEKKVFRRLFPHVKFSFYTLADFKRKNKKNRIKENCILNFVYRPHYVSMPYHKYPNSFDPYILNPNQRILDIIQGFMFAKNYAWDKYEYTDMYYQLLRSCYRKDILGLSPQPTPPNFTKPQGETDVEDDEYVSYSVPTYKVYFDDNTTITIAETALFVHEREGIRRISSIKEWLKLGYDIVSLKNDSIQKIEDAESPLLTFIDKKSSAADDNEVLIRNDYYKRGEISLEEHNSGVYLWKILLKHIVDKKGTEQVYQDIMESLREKDRIRSGAFKNWYNLTSPMILPLHVKSQKMLMQYLDLDKGPYLKIMRSKKLSTLKGTRRLNQMLHDFMINYLFAEIDESKYEEFKQKDINDILQIDSLEDLQALISLIQEPLKYNLKTIKSIEE